MEAFTNANWAGNRRSTLGYCTFVGGNLVTWRSKKKTVAARSSTEVELKVVAQGMCELLWLRKLLEELRIKIEGPVKLYRDNKTAINIANNPMQEDKTKHVKIDRHFIKEKLESGLICMPFVSTNE